MDVHILSDIDVDLKKFQNLKKYNKHFIKSLSVHYNKMGKDFNDTYVDIVKEII